MPRFLHTSDWQLGMTRRFMNPDAQARYGQARLDAVRGIGRLARDEDCAFIAVAGDVFEWERMDRRTVSRALEAMADCRVPVLLLPGNHDPYHDDSVYASRFFAEQVPANVRVLSDAAPVRVTDDVEVVGAPWHSKHPVGNPVLPLLDGLGAADGFFRVCLAHGYADTRSFFPDKEALIPVDRLEQAVRDGKIHYAALGDKHSADVLDREGRIRYSGTPEQTDFDEERPGHVSIVELLPDGVLVRERKVGTWAFLKLERSLAGPDDVHTLERDLEAVPDKTATLVRLDLSGSLGPAEDEDLRRRLENLALRFAGLEVRNAGYFVNPGNLEQLCRNLTGYAADAAETLLAAAQDGDDGRAATDALLLLARLAPVKEDRP